MYSISFRVFQGIMKFSSAFMPWRKPILLKGKNSLRKLPELLSEHHIRRVLIVTDRGIVLSGIMNEMLQQMKHRKIRYVLYDKTVSNPTIDNIEEALQMYYQNHCSWIIGFGGGSAMDCAKGVAARVAQPELSISQMKGLMKIHRKTPTLVAVPTTSGTGSEATLAAVITDSQTMEKYPISDFSLIPKYAVLDPELTIKLPPHITATSGMDALTHAVEAYIGRSNTKDTRAYSRMAVKLIFRSLYRAYTDGDNLKAREDMQKASYYAGMAFTKAYVGNVHAIAHTLGGVYSIPHGLANAVILPYVLEYYGCAVYKSLAELADLVGLNQAGDNHKKKAERFIYAIREMNKKMGLPEKLTGINEKDIPLMAERAYQEANPLYPVPVIFSKSEFKFIYYCIME